MGEELEQPTRAVVEAVTLLAAAARSRAPRATGQLVGSIAAGGFGSPGSVVASARYAVPVHQGVPARNQRAQPFMAAAAESVEWVDPFAAYAEDAVDRIAGRRY